MATSQKEPAESAEAQPRKQEAEWQWWDAPQLRELHELPRRYPNSE